MPARTVVSSVNPTTVNGGPRHGDVGADVDVERPVDRCFALDLGHSTFDHLRFAEPTGLEPDEDHFLRLAALRHAAHR